MSTHLVWWTALSNTNTFLFWHLWTGWNSRPSLHDAAQILPLLGDIQRHCISRLSFTISYANKVIKINRCLETCQYWGKACNAINIFPENMDNHTEILLNTFKSVAYDDNWALQHEKCAFNQLRNNSKKLSTCIFWYIAVLTSEEDAVQKCISDQKITAPKNMHVKSTFLKYEPKISLDCCLPFNPSLGRR